MSVSCFLKHGCRSTFQLSMLSTLLDDTGWQRLEINQKTRGHVLSVLVSRCPGRETVEEQICIPDVQLLAVTFCPSTESPISDAISAAVAKQQTQHSNASMRISGEFNQPVSRTLSVLRLCSSADVDSIFCLSYAAYFHCNGKVLYLQYCCTLVLVTKLEPVVVIFVCQQHCCICDICDRHTSYVFQGSGCRHVVWRGHTPQKALHSWIFKHL